VQPSRGANYQPIKAFAKYWLQKVKEKRASEANDRVDDD
jgi:hypothetical protein